MIVFQIGKLSSHQTFFFLILNLPYFDKSLDLIVNNLGANNLKSFSRILFKFVMHVTNDQFSDKFNNGRKKKKMSDLKFAL